ncbi:hypothetical protein QTP88_024031 [Uroleucon formosanum]
MPPTTPNSVSQVATRAKTATLLTLDVFNKTMAEHQKTQIETLDQYKLLCESQSSKFTELNESISHLSTQVADLKLDNDNLRENISNLNKRIQDLKAANSCRPTFSAGTVPSILQEISERERCSRNVIIRGLKESSSSVIEERISDDTSKIVETIDPYFPEAVANLKSIRLGKPNDRGPRPLKVFSSSKEIALKLVSDFNKNARGLPPDSRLRSVTMTRDRTPLERVYPSCGVYLPPHSPLPVVESHVASVEQIISSYKSVSVILCGDYNLPNVTWSSDELGLIATNDHNMVTTSIIDSFSFLNFFQHNFLPNSHGSILDLIFSNSNKVTSSTATESLVIPDPYYPPLHIIFPFQSDNVADNTHTYKDFKDANYSGISQFFNSFNWESTFSECSIDGTASIFNEALLHSIELFVPTKIYKLPKFPLWTSPTLKNLILKKKRAHAVFKRTKLPCDYLAFSELHNHSMKVFPAVWKISSVTPVFKSGDPSLVSNYRPISILPHTSKLLESIVYTNIKRSLNHILVADQHGFRPGKYTTTCILALTSYILESFESDCQVDAVFTDFSKAFDSVIHNHLISELESLGIGNPLLSWLQSYLSPRMQFVKIHGATSDLSITPSGVPQGGHLSPLQFIIFINSINNYLSFSKVLLFADDIKIYSKVASISDCRQLQSDLDSLCLWTQRIGLTLNLNKCHRILAKSINLVSVSPSLQRILWKMPVKGAEAVAAPDNARVGNLASVSVVEEPLRGCHYLTCLRENVGDRSRKDSLRLGHGVPV